jgi:DNA-binding response OmpR family regulator
MSKDEGTFSIADSVKPAGQNKINPPQRILVADDDEHIRLINTGILSSAGYEVEAVSDGGAAWKALQQKRYDLLLTDNNMPKMSGLVLIENLQAAGIRLPVIMVTGVPPPAKLSQNLQIEAMLLKPYKAEELLAKVRNVLYAMADDEDLSGIYRPAKPDDAQDGTRQ